MSWKQLIFQRVILTPGLCYAVCACPGLLCYMLCCVYLPWLCYVLCYAVYTYRALCYVLCCVYLPWLVLYVMLCVAALASVMMCYAPLYVPACAP